VDDHTLFLEVEIVCQVAALMVPTQHEERRWVQDLVRKEQQTHFAREAATIDIVSKEQVRGIGRVTSNFQKFHQIIVLSMHITAHCTRVPNAIPKKQTKSIKHQRVMDVCAVIWERRKANALGRNVLK
jgi:hypothetical protein